jgi:hypothetical protein
VNVNIGPIIDAITQHPIIFIGFLVGLLGIFLILSAFAEVNNLGRDIKIRPDWHTRKWLALASIGGMLVVFCILLETVVPILAGTLVFHTSTPSPTSQVTPSPTGQVTPSPTSQVTSSPTGQVTPSPTGQVTSSPTGQVTPSPNPSLQTFTDNFSSETFPNDNWKYFFSNNAHMQVKNDQLIATIIPNLMSEVKITSKHLYTIMEGKTFIEVPQVSSGSSLADGVVDTAFGIENEDGTKAVAIECEGQTLLLETYVQGNDVTLVKYNAASQRWWGIQESSGQVSLEVSPDGKTWNTIYTLTDPFDMSQVRVAVDTNEFSPTSTAGPAIFANLNIVQG